QGYLRYAFLKNRLGNTAPAEIRRFLQKNEYAPVSAQLRERWLTQLASRGDWETFLQEYRPLDNPTLQCLRLRQLLKANESPSELTPEIERLWLTDTRLPSACNAVFVRWRKAGYLTDELIWQRIALLMARYRSSLAGELANQYLSAKDRTWVRRWQAMHRQPLRELQKLRYPVNTPRAQMIVKHGIVRLGYRDPDTAMAQWQRLKGKHSSLAEANDEIVGTLATLASRRHEPIAVEWFSNIPDYALDTNRRLWRLRAALRAGRWDLARGFVESLSEQEQEDRFWWYWTARIMEETGDAAKARYLYAILATGRNYYSFLAADRLNTGYVMHHQAVDVSPATRANVLARPGIQAARELYALGDIPAARRQWSWTLARMNGEELDAAALVARDWGWYDRAIFTLSRSGYMNDLNLRFPVLYRDLVEANAVANNLDPSWIYGVMRQESAFMVDARSPAGALGLMQLMPRVGRSTAKRLKLKVRGRGAMLEVENNLRLGTAFLRELLRRYRGHQMLATAAYNAGPSRVESWRPKDDTLAADIWVETIPYNETRDYVKNVMAYTVVYDHRLEREPIRLCARMPVVPSAGDGFRRDRACPDPEPAGRQVGADAAPAEPSS
ncbi:MAG: transglycosylase SLT domain-containing protein, partial [Acidiferrobacterales bacterium]